MRVLILSLLPAFAAAQITDLRVMGTTTTSAVLAYTAPTDAACTWEVSRYPSFTPLVPDVDPAKGGNPSDSRPGSITAGRARTMRIGWQGTQPQVYSFTGAAATDIITSPGQPWTGDGSIRAVGGGLPAPLVDGTKYYVRDVSGDTFKLATTFGGAAIDLTSDGSGTWNWYHSRALENNTLHYGRATCGGDTATISFTTKNPPWGETRNEGLRAREDGGGYYDYPTIHPDDKSRIYVDPQNGTPFRLVITDSEWNNGAGKLQEFDGGHQYSCQRVIATDSGGNRGAFCFSMGHGDGIQVAWVDADTGEGRYMGRVWFSGVAGYTAISVNWGSANWDNDLVGDLYASGIIETASNLGALAKCTFTGSFEAAVPGSTNYSCSWEIVHPDLNGVLETFTVGHPLYPFEPVNYRNCGFRGIRLDNRAFVACQTGSQDTLAYFAMYDIIALQFIAARPGWMGPDSRWSAFHSMFPHDNGDSYFVENTGLNGDVVSGPDGPYESTITGCDVLGGDDGCDGGQLVPCTEPCQSRVTLTSPNSTPGEPYNSSGVGPAQLWGPMVAEPGDVFRLDGPRELVRITVKHSPTSWTVDRGLGNDSPGSHTLPKTGQMASGAATYDDDLTVPGDNSWDYGTDPWGTTAVRTIPNDVPIKSHLHIGQTHAITSETRWGICPTADANDIPDCTALRVIGDPGFDGVDRRCAGNACQSHPRGDALVTPGTPQYRFGLDGIPIEGDTLLEPATFAAVSGQLYKITPHALTDQKRFEMFATVGARRLRDISSPATGDVISDTAANEYGYCWALQANECRTGSVPGEVFFNTPGDLSSLPTPQGYCMHTSRNQMQDDDICFGANSAFAYAQVQIWMESERPANKSKRRLFRAPDWRTNTIFWNTRALPIEAANGNRFALAHLTNQHADNRDQNDLAAWRIAPMPPVDSTPRDQFIQFNVELGPSAPALGIDNAIVEFGYDDQLRCGTRNEVCVAAQGGDPFFWATTESFSGVPCSSGCTITVPAISNKVLYYRHVYRDGGDAVLGTSNIQFLNVP